MLFFAFCLFFSTLLSAQPEGVALRRISTDEGLSHNYVGCIAKDTQGFMWFGTLDGLTRFDGKRCTVFRPREGDPNSLPSNIINGLSLDPLGRLWVSTSGGVCQWDYVDRHFRRLPSNMPAYPGGLPFSTPFSLDKNGCGWAMADTFLVRLDYRSLELTCYALPDQLGGASATFVDSKGRIWISVTGNVFRFSPENGHFEFKMGRKADDPAKKVIAGGFVEDEHGRLWCSTWGHGLFMLNEATGTFDDFDDGPSITTVYLFDRHPVAGPIVWAGGGTYGLYWQLLLEGNATQFPPRPKEPFSHNNTIVRSIYKDPETNIVWLGTDMGVEKYDPNDLKFTRIMLPDSIAPDQFSGISGIVPDPGIAGKYWISIWGKGLVEWDRREQRFRHYSLLKKTKGLVSDEVFDLIADRHGKIWLAEYKCVQEFDPATKRFRTFEPPFPTAGINHKVLQIMESKDGRIWLGSNYEGLYWLDPASGHIEHVRLDGKSHYVRALAEDSRGRVLVGDVDGFFRYDPATGRHEKFLQKDSVFHPCNDFAFDRQHRLWVATHGGLFQLDDNGHIEFALTTRNGLQNNWVNSVEFDMEDRLWVATSNGLHRFYPPTGRVDLYYRPDGLFANDISGAFRMLPRGELFAGFQDAFNIANTSRLPMNPYAPRVALTDVFILNKPARWRMGEPVVLHPGDNVVAFDFAALNYTQPEKTMLVYKLEDFNRDWVETRQHTITYTNLDGGDYTLLVRARNGDGIWSSETVRIKLHVIPPFTKTVWFRLMLLGLAASLIAGIAWYRQQQRLKLEAIRQRIARDLHDDMGSTVSSIRFFSEVAQSQLSDNQTSAKGLLSRISQSAATLSESIQDIVWAINASHDNLEDLVARIREFGLKISEARGIRFTAHIPASLPPLALRPDHRRNIYLIFKEAVNNAAKYSGCSEIGVALQQNRRKLFLEIKDNGKGFDPAAVQYGNGIANMRQRATEIGGKLELKTAPGEGVRIGLEVGL